MKSKLFSKPRKWILISAGTSLLVCLLIFLLAPTEKDREQEVQKNFLELEIRAEAEAEELLQNHRNNKIKHSPPGLMHKHIYENDSLVY